MNEELIKRIDERFVSLNEVPVRDVRLTREEWTQIRTTVLNCRTARVPNYPLKDHANLTTTARLKSPCSK